MHLDVATGGELPRRPRRRACRPTGWCCTATTSRIDELRTRPGRRRRPHRRRLASTSSTASSALVAEGLPVPAGAAAGHARRRGPHPRVRADRPGRLEVRLRRRRRARPPRPSSGRRRRRRSSWSGCTPTSAARSSWPTSSTGGRGAGPVRSRATTCPSCRVGGGLGVAYVEGEEAPTITEWGDGRARGAATTPASPAPGDGRAGPGHRGRGRASPSTRSAPIKEIPGIRTYVSVDGGMSDNPRPVLYGSGYEAFLPRAVGAERPRRRHGGGQALRVGRRAGARGARCPPTSPSATSSPRRSPAPTATRWARNYNKVPAPGRWCSCATARPAWSCGARPTTTCCASTWD